MYPARHRPDWIDGACAVLQRDAERALFVGNDVAVLSAVDEALEVTVVPHQPGAESILQRLDLCRRPRRGDPFDDDLDLGARDEDLLTATVRAPLAARGND